MELIILPKQSKIAKQVFSEYDVPYEVLGVMDAKKLDFEDQSFDAILDRAALQHNTYEGGKLIIEEVKRVLKKGGYYYLTATSEDHYLFNHGKSLGNGAFIDNEREGVRQFYSNAQIPELFANDVEIVKWHKIENINVLKNSRIGTIHHVGCIRV